MPVIKHFTGNCHVYVDAAADLDMADASPLMPNASGWESATRPNLCWYTPQSLLSFCRESARP